MKRLILNSCVLLFIFVCLLGYYSQLEAQQSVTGGEDLIPYVRKIKQNKSVHLEWLYLENRIDQLPEQKAIVRSGKPLEFGAGYLYHGRDGLDEILINEHIPGQSYWTRAAHVWAIGSFHDQAQSPAIFVISALDFNRLRDEGKAVLEAEVSMDAGIMDPYPKITSEIPLDMVEQIWIGQDTWIRYQDLLSQLDEKLTDSGLKLKTAVHAWNDAQKLIIFEGLHHTRHDKETFYPVAYEIVGKYFVRQKLYEKMPRFRIRKKHISYKQQLFRLISG